MERDLTHHMPSLHSRDRGNIPPLRAVGYRTPPRLGYDIVPVSPDDVEWDRTTHSPHLFHGIKVRVLVHVAVGFVRFVTFERDFTLCGGFEAVVLITNNVESEWNN